MRIKRQAAILLLLLLGVAFGSCDREVNTATGNGSDSKTSSGTRFLLDSTWNGDTTLHF